MGYEGCSLTSDQYISMQPLQRPQAPALSIEWVHLFAEQRGASGEELR